MYYKDFLNDRQAEIVEAITDALGLDRCFYIEWTLGNGWDDIDVENMTFLYYKSGKDHYGRKEVPVRVTIELFNIGEKSVDITLGRFFGDNENLTVPQNGEYIAKLIRAKWEIFNGKNFVEKENAKKVVEGAK